MKVTFDLPEEQMTVSMEIYELIQCFELVYYLACKPEALRLSGDEIRQKASAVWDNFDKTENGTKEKD